MVPRDLASIASSGELSCLRKKEKSISAYSIYIAVVHQIPPSALKIQPSTQQKLREFGENQIYEPYPYDQKGSFSPKGQKLLSSTIFRGRNTVSQLKTENGVRRLALFFLKPLASKYFTTRALGMILFSKLNPKISGFLARTKESQPN
ncbi:hypothetical protein CR513_54494, partial [Mucuna pruriens]